MDSQLANQLETAARHAVEEMRRRAEEPFAPEYLIIYLSNKCNLACAYCYTDQNHRSHGTWKNRYDSPVIEEDAIRAAASLVAPYCAKKNRTFHLVINGGGEPSLHPELIDRSVSLTREAANLSGIGWFGYLITNGVLTEKSARRLAEQFDIVELSCDGPPEIQNCQRPLAGSGASSPYIERTARILHESGRRWEVRTTITPQTVRKQEEIVEYLHESLRATRMRFEPVYRIHGTGGTGFTPGQAECFVEHFLAAQQKASGFGAELVYSGLRLDEVHGGYCNVLKQALHLIPGNVVTACFFNTEGREIDSLSIGQYSGNIGTFELDEARIAELRRRAAQLPEHCQDCLNAYHCIRECPEKCSLTVRAARCTVDSENITGQNASFRCLLQLKLTESWILEAANKLLSANGQLAVRLPGKIESENHAVILKCLNKISQYVDTDSILKQWDAIRSRYAVDRASLPLPVWAKRGFEHNGTQAWQELTRNLAGHGSEKPLSIYIHVPFCDRRCGFCNSYSLPVGRRKRQKEEDYSKTLLHEMELWSRIKPLRRRPVTTVHFGGGTPNSISPKVFARIIDKCKACFSVIQRTEWALESTSSLLTNEHLRLLQQWGFTRLHVGVQTLEGPVRSLIGRRESSDEVVEKISHALEMGFIVSVDVMYGLPEETLAGFMTTLHRLIALGIHGFSVYGLVVTGRNRIFLERHNSATADALRNYVSFQAGEQFLLNNGYKKTHFIHFARPQDTNLYYSHPSRGEDRLAFGPTADGMFDHYHYRHPEYEDYIAGIGREVPTLEGGVLESHLERTLNRINIALQSGTITVKMLQELMAEPLLDQWLECALVEEGANPESFILTANGSWFVNDMIGQVTEIVRACI